MKYVKVAAVIIVALAAVFAARRYAGHPSLPARPPMGGEARVVVEAVASRPFANRIEALGTARASESVTITATVAERVARILFEEGSTVKAGDVLVELDDAEERAQVDEAAVTLAEQRRELGRVSALREKEMVSEQELDSRRTAADAAAARLAAVQAKLKDRLLTAPFDGVVGLRRVSPGALVNPGTAITTLDDVRTIKVDFACPETLLGELEAGQAVEARSAAWDDRVFTGTVAAVDSRVDAATRAVTVQARLPNPEGLLRPGMFLTITLISRPRDAVGVPEKALLAYASRHYAFVLQPDGTALRREVSLGNRDAGWVEILRGLSIGETLVVEGLMDLRDGARVKVVEPAGAAPSPAR